MIMLQFKVFSCGVIGARAASLSYGNVSGMDCQYMSKLAWELMG